MMQIRSLVNNILKHKNITGDNTYYKNGLTRRKLKMARAWETTYATSMAISKDGHSTGSTENIMSTNHRFVCHSTDELVHVLAEVTTVMLRAMRLECLFEILH